MGDPTLSDEALLQACGTAPDCRFFVLDTRPHPALGEQLRRCARWAGPHLGSCAIHAGQAWARRRPDAEARRQALQDPEARRWEQEVAAGLGWLALCGGPPCTAHPGWEAACADAVAHLRDRGGLCEGG